MSIATTIYLNPMIFPYPHSAALAQVPVPYFYKDAVLLIYPLRLRDVLDMDMWLKSRVVKEYHDQVELLPPGEREEFVAGLSDIIAGINGSSGRGYRLLWSNADALLHLAVLLTRGVVEEDRLRELIFPNGLTEESVDVVTEMKRSVWRDLPPVPELKVVEKKPRYETTKEESEARIYHMLAEKYHWTYDQILDLTDYQAFWFGYMFPEEREHYEDIDAMIHQSKASLEARGAEASPSPKPGVIHFNSPEEYEAWKARQASRG